MQTHEWEALLAGTAPGPREALEGELRAMQSVGASVRVMYSVAGRGEL